MAEETRSTAGNTEPGAGSSAGASSGNGLAFGLHTIKLNEPAKGRDFERFMIREVFPAVNTQDPQAEDMGPDQHFLLASGGGGEYVWMIRLEYFMHHTPLPNWLLNRVDESYSSVKDKIEPFGTLVSTQLFYDVEAWLQRVGFE